MLGLLDEGEVRELAALMQGGRALSKKELQAAMVCLLYGSFRKADNLPIRYLCFVTGRDGPRQLWRD